MRSTTFRRAGSAAGSKAGAKRQSNVSDQRMGEPPGARCRAALSIMGLEAGTRSNVNGEPGCVSAGNCQGEPGCVSAGREALSTAPAPGADATGLAESRQRECVMLRFEGDRDF